MGNILTAVSLIFNHKMENACYCTTLPGMEVNFPSLACTLAGTRFQFSDLVTTL